MPGFTPNFNVPLPTVTGDADVWGDELNSGNGTWDTVIRNIANCNVGATAPTTVPFQTGTLWLNNSVSTSWPLSIYNGTNTPGWVSLGVVNPITNVFLPTGVGSVPGIQYLTTSGNYTPLASVRYIMIDCIAGGGAGGSVSSGSFGGGGGGAGSWTRAILTADLLGGNLPTIEYTIGAGGAASSAGSGAGGAGGNTYFGPSLTPLVTANGGNGSASSAASAGAGVVPGLGGSVGSAVGSNNQFNLAGQNGAWGATLYQNNVTFIGPGGNGGSTIYGSGGVSLPSGGGAGVNGGGGAGAYNVGIPAVLTSAGNGGAGYIVVYEYYI